MTEHDPTPDAFDDVLGLLEPTELHMPATLTVPYAPQAPAWAADLPAAVKRDADEAWSLAMAFLADEDAAWEALTDGFARLGRSLKGEVTLGDTLEALAPALLEVARLLAKSGSLPEVRGAALSPEVRLGLLVQASFPQAGAELANPGALRRALVSAYPQPGHPRGDELCALLAHDVLGTLAPEQVETLAELRAAHPTSAALIQARYLETVEVPLLVQPRIEALVAQVEAQLAREAEHAEAVSAVQLQTAVKCAYCHDRLRRPEAAFCSSCLAPHHAECFAQHGRCSAPGCGEVRLVQPREAAQSRRRPRWPWLAAGLVGLGAAAWAGVSEFSGSWKTASVDPAILREAQSLTEAANAERAQREAEREAYRAQLDALEVTLDFEGETPLEDCVAFLRDVTGLNFVFDSSAGEVLVDQRLGTGGLLLRDIKLRNALTLLLDACSGDEGGLSYRVEPGLILISGDSPPVELELQTHSVADLLNGEARRKGGVWFSNPDLLIDTLESHMNTELSESDYYEGTIEYVSGALVVRKSAVAHAFLRKRLQHFRTNKPEVRKVPAWKAKLDQQLDSSVFVFLKDDPLSEAVTYLQDQGCSVMLGGNVNGDTPVNLHLKGLTVRQVLTVLAEQVGLAWSLRDGAIVLEHPYVRVSDCSLLLYESPDLLNWLESDQLVEVVQNAIGEDQWDEPTSIEVVGDHLFVFQTEAIHREVEAALAALRVSLAENAAQVERDR